MYWFLFVGEGSVISLNKLIIGRIFYGLYSMVAPWIMYWFLFVSKGSIISLKNGSLVKYSTVYQYGYIFAAPWTMYINQEYRQVGAWWHNLTVIHITLSPISSISDIWANKLFMGSGDEWIVLSGIIWQFHEVRYYTWKKKWDMFCLRWSSHWNVWFVNSRWLLWNSIKKLFIGRIFHITLWLISSISNCLWSIIGENRTIWLL
jgi:hypothetical protein